MKIDRTYILIEKKLVTQDMVDACIQTSLETLSTEKVVGDDKIYTVLKWEGNKPKCFDGVTLKTEKSYVDWQDYQKDNIVEPTGVV